MLLCKKSRVCGCFQSRLYYCVGTEGAFFEGNSIVSKCRCFFTFMGKIVCVFRTDALEVAIIVLCFIFVLSYVATLHAPCFDVAVANDDDIFF